MPETLNLLSPPQRIAARPWPLRTTATNDGYRCEGLSFTRIAGFTGFTLAMIFVNKFGIVGNGLFFVVVAGLMVSKPLHAVMGMNLAMLGLIVNFAFVSKTVVWTLARFANLFLFTGRFAVAGVNTRWMTSPAYLWLTAFCIVAALCSVLSGYYVHVALLKLVSFWVATTGFFAAIHDLRLRRVDTTEWFISQTLAICVLCVLSLVLGVAQNFKEFATQAGLYNLAFYHSQTMGPGAAFLITYCACVFLFSGHRNRWICLPIIGFLGYCLTLTGSRTGFGTAVIGVGTALFAAFTWKASKTKRPRLNLSRSSLLVCGLLGLVTLGGLDAATGGRLSKRFASFITKKQGDVEEITVDATIATRRGIAEQTWQSFLDNPLTGIGFQVAKTEFFVQNATYFSAPIEKGFMPTAILEEVGVLGTTVFFGFLVALFVQLRRERNIPGLAMFVAHLASNLGEASYFAVAGQGGFAWIMFMAAVLLGDRCTTPTWMSRIRRGYPAE